jgi:hypothetical protein
VLFFFFNSLLSKKKNWQDQDEKTRASWQTLAGINHLDFVFAGSHRRGLYIKGIYHGYNLELFTDWMSHGRSIEVGTCLELRVSQPVTTSPVLIGKETNEPIVMVHGKEFSLKQAVNRLAPILSDKDLPGVIKLWGYEGISYQQPEIIGDTRFLQTLFDRLSDVMDFYQGIVNVGGEAVPFLESLAARKDSRLQALLQLLGGISSRTTSQLSDYASLLFCPNCFVSYGSHQMTSLWRSFYGCRACGQSRKFFYCPEGVIAVLDMMWSGKYNKQDGLLRVNWLAHRSLFDFNQVEIVQTTDEDVERFAVQVGNDTDPHRQPRYSQIPCIIAPTCKLSENTLRILRHTFGRVEQKEFIR